MRDAMYVIYDDTTTDYPGRWVIRRWDYDGILLDVDRPFAVRKSLEQARSCVPPGMCWLPRQDDDDPVIREVWL